MHSLSKEAEPRPSGDGPEIAIGGDDFTGQNNEIGEVVDKPPTQGLPLERMETDSVEDVASSNIAAHTPTAPRRARAKALKYNPKTTGQAEGPSVQRSRSARNDLHLALSDTRATFIDEVTNLDQEIRDIRKELSSKLKVQNAQLRRMLARFDKG